MLSFENRKKVFKGDNMTAATTGSTQKPYVSEQPKQPQPKKETPKITFNGREIQIEDIVLGPPLGEKTIKNMRKILDDTLNRTKT